MRVIRRIVYRLGFRPKPGSIFYSPSRAFAESFWDSYKAAVKAMEDCYDEEGRVKGPYKLFVEGGHAFKADESGELKTWDSGIHDGYICILCDDYLCRNCDADWATQKCPENPTPALPGLELEVTPSQGQNENGNQENSKCQ